MFACPFFFSIFPVYGHGFYLTTGIILSYLFSLLFIHLKIKYGLSSKVFIANKLREYPCIFKYKEILVSVFKMIKNCQIVKIFIVAKLNKYPVIVKSKVILLRVFSRKHRD